MEWGNQQQDISKHPEDSRKAGIRLAIGSVGNEPRNQVLIMAEGVILGWISPSVGELMKEKDMEGHG